MQSHPLKRKVSKIPTKKNHKVQKTREVISEPDTAKANISEIQGNINQIEADLQKLKNKQLEEEKDYILKKNICK